VQLLVSGEEFVLHGVCNFFFASYLCCLVLLNGYDCITGGDYSPSNSQAIVLTSSVKIYIKIAPTCFGVVTPSSGSALVRALLKLHFVKIVNYGSSVCGYISGDVAAYVGSVLVGVCMLHCSVGGERKCVRTVGWANSELFPLMV